ncbi:hypothetical protein BH11BAC3_BH11BAC3_39980 [soil metagenome]
MKTIITTTLSILLFAGSYAQNKNFDASLIPEDLKKNAHAVKREEHIEFEVKSINKASYKVHQVITILDENGKDELEFHEFSDQFHSLESVNIQLFDSKGNSLKKYKRSDLSIQTSGEGLVPDGKVYFIQFPSGSYPVTMMVDYELRYTGLLNYPDYYVQFPEQSVENSMYTATVPVDLDLRYKNKNTNLAPVVAGDGKVKTYTWTSKNLPALAYEPGSVSSNSRYPHVILSPNKFELDNYSGDMSSWESFGKWYGDLSKNTSNLTNERKEFFKSMVKDAGTDLEKIKLIYNYLQTNCRYVSIQLGIGGFKPFEADFVDKKKYGDCKALSNYTQACLGAVGIKSYQALINASYNQEPVDPAFPHNGFNHVIVCVPLNKDTVWLECTSNSTEVGVLGNFTENRNALLITENGGKLVPTPRSKASENILATHSNIDLAEDGSGIAKITMYSNGEFKQDFIHYISNKKKDDQKRFLVRYIGYMQPDDFEIIYDQADKKAATKMAMSISKVPEFTAGKKMFLNPRIYKIWNEDLPKTENRTQDYYFENPYIKTDTTIYKLPEGYGIESLPKAKNLKFDYGNFSSTYTFDEAAKTVTSVAKLELDEYKIPAAKFAAMRNFFNEVSGEYTEKIVIKKL